MNVFVIPVLSKGSKSLVVHYNRSRIFVSFYFFSSHTELKTLMNVLLLETCTRKTDGKKRKSFFTLSSQNVFRMFSAQIRPGPVKGKKIGVLKKSVGHKFCIELIRVNKLNFLFYGKRAVR